MKNKVLLLILDGWGHRLETKDNAIANSPTPTMDELMKTSPTSILDAAGEAVGLPDGYMGNSEVGHLTIGCGRVIDQPFMQINKAIESGEFYENEVLLETISHCKKNNSTLHLMGILHIKAVHGHRDHLLAILETCKKNNFSDVAIHAFTDGRDGPVNKSYERIAELKNEIERIGVGNIMTFGGRYFGMDRDKRWDRTRKAYDAIVSGKSEKEGFTKALEGIHAAHESGETDEFLTPRCRVGYEGVEPGDGMLFWNFRTDRPRQLTKAIVEKDFPGWKREPLDVKYATMTQYYDGMNAQVLFPDNDIDTHLGSVVSKTGLSQLRVTETEKYAHVTFFMNGQNEEPYEGENRVLIPSDRTVATYDEAPQMKAREITEEVVKAMNEDQPELIVSNLVNADMVGHTADLEAIAIALKAVDDCVERIVQVAEKNGYTVIVTADHGNAEDQSPGRRTSHTTHPVPCVLVHSEKKLRESGSLSDIAPTILEILEIEKPEIMTGKSLII